MPPTPALLPPDAGPSEPSAPHSLLPPDAGPSEPSERCRGTVAYLFLLPGTVREPFALPQTWGEYFAGCEEGEATVHLHAQGANDGSWLAAQGLPFRVDSVVADPVQGELRFNFTMQEAMLKLWAAGANATAANGCAPAWHQLLSDNAAPLQPCREVHARLRATPPRSRLWAWECDVLDLSCAGSGRRPRLWRNPRPPRRFFKASQWSTLTDGDARALLASAGAEAPVWRGAYTPDEHFTPNVLDALGSNFSRDSPTTYVMGYVPFTGHAYELDCDGKDAHEPPLVAAAAGAAAVPAGASSQPPPPPLRDPLCNATGLCGGRASPDAKRNAWEEGSWPGGKRAAEFALDLASGPAASASAVTLQAELAQNSPETLRGVLARAQAGGYLFARKFSRSCDRMLAIEMARGWPAR